MMIVFWLVMIFIEFGFTVWLGLKRGDTGDNAALAALPQSPGASNVFHAFLI